MKGKITGKQQAADVISDIPMSWAEDMTTGDRAGGRGGRGLVASREVSPIIARIFVSTPALRLS